MSLTQQIGVLTQQNGVSNAVRLTLPRAGKKKNQMTPIRVQI